MEHLTDIEIVRQVVAGDTEAFALLVERYSAAVYRLAVRIVGEEEQAAEVVQDAFVRAYEHLDTFRGAATFATWLYRIAYNRAVGECRRRKYLSFDVLRNMPAEEESDGAYDEDTIARMRRALARLSPEERALIVLFYEEERSVAEIAGITGLSVNNIKVKLHRVRHRIRQYMEE